MNGPGTTTSVVRPGRVTFSVSTLPPRTLPSTTVCFGACNLKSTSQSLGQAGGKNAVDVVVVERSHCPKCGSPRRSEYRGRVVQKCPGLRADGTPYAAIPGTPGPPVPASDGLSILLPQTSVNVFEACKLLPLEFRLFLRTSVRGLGVVFQHPLCRDFPLHNSCHVRA